MDEHTNLIEQLLVVASKIMEDASAAIVSLGYEPLEDRIKVAVAAADQIRVFGEAARALVAIPSE